MGRNIISRLIAVAAGAVAVVAGLALADRLLPPDLSRYRDLSTTIVDSDGRLLRAFTSTDGFWRLPATPDAVEPAGFSRQVQHLMFSRNASAGVLYPRHFLGVELTAHVISSISRAV